VSLSTIPAALTAAMAGDAARPFITYVGPAGERTELSVRTFENNVAKAANLLRDDGDVHPGTVVAIDLPLHWQTSIWLAACAMVGGLAWVGGDTGSVDTEVGIVGPAGLDLPVAPLALATSLHPFGMPFTQPLPEGVLDAAVEVRAHGDRFTPGPGVTAKTLWIRWGESDLTQSDALGAGAALATALGVAHGGRLLCARPLDAESLLALLALPLAVSGSVVLLADPDADPVAVAASERCVAILR
jgi:uncharacterized protein (TIGR03089 family)